MGTGLYKLTTSGDCSETKYTNIFDINLLNYKREIESLEQFKGKKLLFLTLASGNVRINEMVQQILASQGELKDNNIQLVGLPTNTYGRERKNFTEQEQFYKDLNIPIFPAVMYYIFYF